VVGRAHEAAEDLDLAVAQDLERPLRLDEQGARLGVGLGLS
jgi:hypothetical protein